MRWLIVFVIACSGGRSTQTTAPGPTPNPVPADAAVAHDAAVAQDDPPEPKAPQVECAFESTTFCIDGAPTRTAMQKPPFEWCARTQPTREQSLYKLDAQFSAVETRKQRATRADACCYIDYFTRACD